ncbi:MAG: hypothetical protein OCC46_09140 [Pseudodesulfovibrio sp.]
MYAVLGFDSDASFEQEEYETEYNGFQLKLVREKLEEHEDRKYPEPISNQLIIPVTAETELAAHEAGLMFLSELSWLHDIAIHAVEHGGGTVPVRSLTKFRGHRGCRIGVDLAEYKPMDLNEDQRMGCGFPGATRGCFRGVAETNKIADLRPKQNDDQWP